MEFYRHPTAGKLPLVVHPDKPWRLVAYFKGNPVFECDKPPGWGEAQELEDQEQEQDQDQEDMEQEEN